MDEKGIRGALTRYRVMAWIVGILLVVLVCVGVPLKYLAGNDTVVTWTGIPHGWLYMIFLLMAFMLSRLARWPIGFTLVTLLCGTMAANDRPEVDETEVAQCVDTLAPVLSSITSAALSRPSAILSPSVTTSSRRRSG